MKNEFHQNDMFGRPSGIRDFIGFFTRHCRGGLKAAVPLGLFQQPVGAECGMKSVGVVDP
ncbi:hypothetical protein LLG95_08735 [bacterium]|nr:hypothetical protein [bacterium]